MLKQHPSAKKLLLILLTVLLLLSLSIGMMPYAIKWGTVYWLKQQGVTASIDHIKLDLNDAILNILNARGSNINGNGFTIKHVHFDFA